MREAFKWRPPLLITGGGFHRLVIISHGVEVALLLRSGTRAEHNAVTGMQRIKGVSSCIRGRQRRRTVDCIHKGVLAIEPHCRGRKLHGNPRLFSLWTFRVFIEIPSPFAFGMLCSCVAEQEQSKGRRDPAVGSLEVVVPNLGI